LVDGATHTTQPVIDGEKAHHSAATRTGYTLEGWYKDSNLSAASKWDFDAMTVTSNVILYAKWTINTYTVKFVDDDGTTVLKQETVNYNSGATAPALPTRTGYTSKWDKTYNAITENLTVTVVYEINTYTVKFVDHDGTQLKEQTVNYNTGATAPASPTRTGYTFASWDRAYNAVTGDLTVTAVYEINQYTVKFVDHDGTTVLKEQTVNYNTPATAPTSPTRTGYTFKNWDKAYSAVTGNLTVKAVYEIIKYTITLNTNNGAVSTTAQTGEGWVLASLSDPAWSGYDFVGWFKDKTDGTKVTESTPFSEDETIYAHWTKIASYWTLGQGVKGTFTDLRDETSYDWVQIGTQVWMAENLNYDVPDNTTDVCYDNSAANCATYGRMYNWTTAMNNAASSSANPSGRQGACPVGWHLPSDAEWTTLTNYVGTNPGTKLKSSQYWTSYSETPTGTDDFGFSALPAGNGYLDGSFYNVGGNGYWWSATEYRAGSAYSRYMSYYNEYVSRDINDETNLGSVRCVQD
jgi:uncharacterized protein (TIGR02145 family)/uncharacterized repeat protein (TIGR02543 family)